MLKNRILGVITAVALVSAAACGGDEAATVEGEGTVVSTDTAIMTTTDTAFAPVVAPVTTTDTTGVAQTTIVEADTTVRTETIPNP